jgi:aspartate aminotransferase/aminotransferase
MALAEGRTDVIHLEVGEPDLRTPAHIIRAAFQAAEDGWTGYTPNAGIRPLREAIAARSSAMWRRPIDPGQVVVTTGAIGALFSASMSILDPGDEVLIPDPGWPNYESILHLAGARPKRYTLRTQTGFLPDMDEVQALTGPRTKAIIVNTPGNPTGAVLPAELMARLVDHVEHTGIYLISDEIYEDIVFESEHVSAAACALSDRVLVVSGVSKSYAMTGWRLGWVVCPAKLAPVVAGLQEPLTSCACAIAQKGAEAALAGDQTCVDELRTRFRRRRDQVVDQLRGSGLLPCAPAGAFYAFVDIGSTGCDSFAFCEGLLKRRAVATVPGVTFGPSSDHFIRIAFTVDDAVLQDGLARIRTHVDELRGARS